MYFLQITVTLLITRFVLTKSDLLSSFYKFKNQLVDFFNFSSFSKAIKSKLGIVENRRQKVKNAFNNFVTESIKLREKLDRFKSSELKLPYIEKNMSAAQHITFHGYQSEVHFVQTRDGYNLEIHRIVSYSPTMKNGKVKVALLHHGIMGSSDDWLLLGPTHALPYLLSDAGYDVWLTNARGNRYSRFDYDYIYQDSNVIWDFSFHEMGYFDLSAVIDYIDGRTKNDLDINFVGHSMGGTVLLTLLSTQPHYNQRLKSATLLAPLAFMIDVKGPFKMLADFYKEDGPGSLDFLGKYDFLPMQKFPQQFIDKFCVSTQKLCLNPLLFMTSGGKIDTKKEFLELLLGHIPAGTSSKTIKHYLQLINSGAFQYFQYEHENFKRYGTDSTPSYNISEITVPFIFFSSLDDWLCTMPGISELMRNIKQPVVHRVVQKPGFTHTDFVWGKNSSTLVYKPIIEILETMR